MQSPLEPKQNIRLSDLLCHRFYMAANAMIRAYRPLLDELDITYPQYLVMLALWEKHEVDVGEIKSRTNIDGGALSLMLKKLVAKDFIYFAKSDKDKRIKLVHLTQKGKDLEAKAAHIPHTLACELDGIPLEELRYLAGSIDKVLAQIKD